MLNEAARSAKLAKTCLLQGADNACNEDCLMI
jgi:hypothetical protein